MQKPLDQYGTESAAKPATAKEGADDDDFDLFGSDVSYILTCIYRYMYSLPLLIPGIFDCILHHFPLSLFASFPLAIEPVLVSYYGWTNVTS